MTIDYDLRRLRALAFDVDGVLSTNIVLLCDDVQPMRTANTKDGYALQLAVKSGLWLAIITGGRSPAVHQRYSALGVQDIMMGAGVKVELLHEWMRRRSLCAEEVLYMGDDIPDIEVMREVGLPCCPQDAADDVKQVAKYISPYPGGRCCVRDVVEQVLRAQGHWMNGAKAFGW